MFRTSLVVAVVVAVVLLLYALKATLVLQDNRTRIVYFRVEGFPAVPSSPSTPLRLLVIGITVACRLGKLVTGQVLPQINLREYLVRLFPQIKPAGV